MVRSGSITTLQPLKERVAACLDAGATAAGCEVDLRWKPVVYADMLDNDVIVGLYAANSAALGRPVVEPDPRQAVVGSTDMGNVSYVVPSIHPMIQAAPAGVPIHTPEFAGHAASAQGDEAVAPRGDWRWPGPWPTCGSRTGSSTRSGPSSRPPWPAVGPDARRSAIEGGAGA